MQWRDTGILLAARRHGESASILEVFTRARGRHAGLLRGGTSRRMVPALQQGSQLMLEWRGRLDEHLGHFRIELVKSRAAPLLSDRLALSALASACALLKQLLAEREPQEEFYLQTQHMLDVLADRADWMPEYLQWELRLLREAGIGLALDRCAVTGSGEELSYVSPRTGRAVSAGAAGVWEPKLLPLPPCLVGGHFSGLQELADGLRMIAHFLEPVLLETHANPPALVTRRRLQDAVARANEKASAERNV
ncbi:MAG: DNA repair protein RecO [Rhodobacteraceae bacterium]|nr:DNA repair protein RecO [Paracoccaceae bacterium]